ncbi:MAG TPA: GNAT family N-acetyltransferase [Actinomycetota bacterium]|jgi:GNAT superfamily N-acetyltransferase|nr:GNAT family N-acetyltransferase [Actinomycetota bacterium]
MAPLEVVPFGEEHLDAAGRLLAERQARHRAAEPLLADEDPRAAVEAAWREPGAVGVVALRSGGPEAYLIAVLEGADPVFGNPAWVSRQGHAASDPEILRDLYAAAAEPWLEAGADRHYVLVPALERDLDTWYRLGFGHMHVEGIRESGADPRPLPGGVTIRRGDLDDLEDAIAIDRLIYSVQERSPSFQGSPDPERWRSAWIETLEDPEVAYFVAETRGRIVGHTTMHPRPEFGTPSDSVYLASTVTSEEVRGTGVGVALAEHALRWARENGYGSVNTGWRMTNLLASRFWPARGFRPFFHRLHRAIGLG